MLGLVDLLSICLSQKNKSEKNGIKKYIIDQPGSETWVCFLPWRMDINRARKYKLLPKQGKLIVYEVPNDLLGETPQLTLNAFGQIKSDFEETFENEKLSEAEMCVLGLSAGTMPAFYFANRIKCKKLIAVCPTIRLGEGIFSALAARKIKKKAEEAGFSAGTYDEAIRVINIENNIDNLPDDVIIYLAKFDRFVPYAGGEELVREIKKRNANVKVMTNHFLGHLMTMFFFGRRNVNL